MLLLQHLQGRVKTLKIQISSKYLELSVPAGSEGTQKNPFSKLFEGTQHIFASTVFSSRFLLVL